MEVNRGGGQKKKGFPFHYIPCIGLYLCVVEMLCFFYFLGSNNWGNHGMPWSDTQPEHEDAIFWNYSYDRFNEVQRECQPFLSSATALEPYHMRKNLIKYGLSFVDGSWSEQSNGVPFMPFFDISDPNSNSSLPSPAKLAYFSVKGVGHRGYSMKLINVTAVLTLAITRNLFSYEPKWLPVFQSEPGTSFARILFEGVYAETEDHGGRRLLCMLGNSSLPLRRFEINNVKGVMNDSVSDLNQSFVHNDRVLLFLSYPKNFTLTSRAVHGEMRSLEVKSDVRYFDKVSLSSQLYYYADYQFKYGGFVSRACNSYQDVWMNGQIEAYGGSKFCTLLREVTEREVFSVVPNWKCDDNYQQCNKLVPSLMNRLNDTNWGLLESKVEMNNVRCEDDNFYDGSVAQVSAVFRALSPSEVVFRHRTALNLNAISAEGIWNSSSGQLCMVGCFDGADRDSVSCDFRICLYMAASLSITQRSVISGSISKLNLSTDLNFPLSIEMPAESWAPYSYKYSKIELARAFYKRSKLFDYFVIIQKLLLSYPNMVYENEIFGINQLAEDLNLYACLIIDQPPKIKCQNPVISLEILSVGPLVGRTWRVPSGFGKKFSSRLRPDSSRLLNVSAELSLEIEEYRNKSISRLYLEGVYDPSLGKMYLVGCRDAHGLLNSSYEQVNIESGYDCTIEVKVEYPPKMSVWLVKPISKISISSHRSQDDPLQFPSIELVTLPIIYSYQQASLLSRTVVESILLVIILGATLVSTIGQVMHMRKNIDDMPFVSLTMVGFQLISYLLQLIKEPRKLIEGIGSAVCDCDKPQEIIMENQTLELVLGNVGRLLLLVTLLLALKIFLMAWLSRGRLNASSYKPSDKQVALISSTIHIVGFLILLYFRSLDNRDGLLSLRKHKNLDENNKKPWSWLAELGEFSSVILDLFLFPQIIANFMWRIDCKPLSKVYYFGMTISRVLLHAHDYIRSPMFDPYLLGEYVFSMPELGFYYKLRNLGITAAGCLLAFIVHIQQG